MKNKTTAALLAFFLGGIGIHQFYLGNNGKGILYLIFSWTFIPLLIAFIDFFILILMSDEQFNFNYNRAYIPQSQTVIQNVINNQPIISHNVPDSINTVKSNNNSYADYVKTMDLDNIERGDFQENSYKWYLQKMIEYYRDTLNYSKKVESPTFSKFEEYEIYVNELNKKMNYPQINYWDYFSSFVK